MTKQERKALRKQVKAIHTLKRHNEDLCDVSDSPTQHLLVANGGLICGVERKHLTSLFQRYGEIQRVVMIPGRSYAFLSYKSVEQAKEAMNNVNGRKLMSPEEFSEPNKILYLRYLSACPTQDITGPTTGEGLPPGLVMVQDFVDESMERTLIDTLGWTNNDEDSLNTVEKQLKHRNVKHFGYEFLYGCNNVDKNNPLPGGLPSACDKVISDMMELGYVNHKPDQLTINEYHPGQGIPPHIDTHSAFEDQIISLSLGSEIVMEFRHPDGQHVSVLVPRRSLLVMGGESRYLWTHGITPRKFDIVNTEGQDAGSDTPSEGHTGVSVQARQTRLSLTFRKVRHTPCSCSYPKHCDSQQNWGSSPDERKIPSTTEDAVRLEQTHVHQVYDQIAEHFSGTRHSPWPKIADFLREQPTGSLVVDVGCGNGKYLGINPNLFKTGSDRSPNLVKICKERGHEVITCDIMSTPYRSNAFDVCLCIAVVHHLATDERRLSALQELVRIVRPGGLVLVYVWAYEQESNKGKAKNPVKVDFPQETSVVQGSSVANESSSRTAHCSVDNQSKGEGEAAISQDVCKDNHGLEQCGVARGYSKGDPPNVEQPQTLANSMSVGSATNESVAQAEKEALPVNSSRSYFQQQDVFVPWHYKGGKKPKESDQGQKSAPVYHRYYHVFQDGELVDLCKRIGNVTVEKHYNDKGNWCVLLRKTEDTAINT